MTRRIDRLTIIGADLSNSVDLIRCQRLIPELLTFYEANPNRSFGRGNLVVYSTKSSRPIAAWLTPAGNGITFHFGEWKDNPFSDNSDGESSDGTDANPEC
jgi:hypothetical protein